MKIERLKNGTFTLTDVSEGDLRFIARAIDYGSYGMDQGGERSKAADRLSRFMRTAASYGKMACFKSTGEPEQCFVEIDDHSELRYVTQRPVHKLTLPEAQALVRLGRGEG